MKNLELKKKFQNKYMIRVAAGALTVAVLGSGTGMAYTVHAEKAEKEVKESDKNSKADKKEIKKTLEKVLFLKNQKVCGCRHLTGKLHWYNC